MPLQLVLLVSLFRRVEPGEGEDLGEQWFVVVVVVVDSLGQAQQGLLMLGLSQVEDAGPAGRENLLEESDLPIRSDLQGGIVALFVFLTRIPPACGHKGHTLFEVPISKKNYL